MDRRVGHGGVMSDHRTLIHEAAQDRTEWMRDLIDAPNWRDEMDEIRRNGPRPNVPADRAAFRRFNRLSQLLDEYGDDTHWSEHVLDVDVLTDPKDPERWRVEFLLSCGGPTESVVCDSRWTTAEFHHSWGMRADGTDCTSWDLSGPDGDVWQDLAADYVQLVLS